MGHHGVVVQDHAQALAVAEMHGAAVGEVQAVERPGVALHVARQMQLDFALGPPGIERSADGLEIGQREHAPAVVAQTDAGVIEVGARHVHAHVGAGAPFGARVAHGGAGLLQRIGRHAVRHAGHAAHGRHVVPAAHALHAGHASMVHPDHGAVAHRGHIVATALRHAAHHVGHREPLHRIQRGHRRAQAGAYRQCGARVAGAIHRLRKERVDIVFGLHNHVVGLAGAEAELIHRHWLHVLPVGLHHGELEARNAHVIERIAAAVDAAQAHALAGFEEGRPVGARRAAVDEVTEYGRGQIGHVARTHAHGVPHVALLQRHIHAIRAHVAQEFDEGGPVLVKHVALRLELGQRAHRVGAGPVRQQHDVLAVGANGFTIARLDDERAIQAGHLLHAAVRVVPVGAALLQRIAVGEGLAGRDAGKAHARYAVHLEWQDDAVPVDRCRLAQAVGDANRHGLAFAHAQRRPGQTAVDGGGDARAAVEVDAGFGQRQVEDGATQLGWRSRTGCWQVLQCPGGQCGIERAQCGTRR